MLRIRSVLFIHFLNIETPWPIWQLSSERWTYHISFHNLVRHRFSKWWKDASADLDPHIDSLRRSASFFVSPSNLLILTHEGTESFMTNFAETYL